MCDAFFKLAATTLIRTDPALSERLTHWQDAPIFLILSALSLSLTPSPDKSPSSGKKRILNASMLSELHFTFRASEYQCRLSEKLGKARIDDSERKLMEGITENQFISRIKLGGVHPEPRPSGAAFCIAYARCIAQRRRNNSLSRFFSSSGTDSPWSCQD